MMTLEESIRFHTEEAEKMKLHKRINELILGSEAYERELQEHRQLADWFRELQERRKEPEIVQCGECLHYRPMSNYWGKCCVHSRPTEKYRTCQICDYCSWAEKKEDKRQYIKNKLSNKDELHFCFSCGADMRG